jgi:hypothetical protein
LFFIYVFLLFVAFVQLDIDTSMLLDSLGDSEVTVSEEGCSELLHRLVTTGARLLKLDPTDSSNVPRLQEADQWSTAETIEKEKESLQAKLVSDQATASRKALKEEESCTGNGEQGMEVAEEKCDNEDDGEGEDLDVKYGGPVDDNIAAHVSFTMSLLERLCNAINESSGETPLQIDMVNAMATIRQLRADKLLLSDRIVTLSNEIIELSAKHRVAENEKIRAERSLDRALLEIKELEQSGLTRGGAEGSSSGIGAAAGATGSQAQQQQQEGTGSASGGVGVVVGGAGAVPPTSPGPVNAAVERELRRQLALAEKQLAESESAKAHVEMTLTERLARPMTQTEVQVADLRSAMEELRQQCKQRVSALVSEVC